MTQGKVAVDDLPGLLDRGYHVVAASAFLASSAETRLDEDHKIGA